MGDSESARQWSEGRRANHARLRFPLRILLPAMFAGSSITACVMHQAGHQAHAGQRAAHRSLDAWYSGDVSSQNASTPASDSEAQVEERADPALGKKITAAHRLGFSESLQGNAGHRSSDDAPVDGPTDAATLPPTDNSAETAPDTNGTGVSENDTLPVTDEAQPVASRTSPMQLFLAFLIGLVLGLFLSILMLLRRREKSAPQRSALAIAEENPTPQRRPADADRDASTQQIQAVKTKKSAPRPDVEPPAIHQQSGFMVPAVAALAADKSVLDQAALSVTDSAATWTMKTRPAVTPEPIVEMAPIVKEELIPPSIPIKPDMYAPARDLRRATLLLEQGELESALSLIEPHLTDLHAIPVVSAAGNARDGTPDTRYIDQIHPLPTALAKLHSDIRWDMAIRAQDGESFSNAASSFRTYLDIKPHDMAARLCLGHCLINLADREPDEMDRMSLLQSCIDLLHDVESTDAIPNLVRLGMLGEVLCRRALLDIVVDQSMLAEAEQVLRQALAKGASDDSGAAWWLQTLLGTRVATIAPAESAARHQESLLLLRRGLAASGSSLARARWQAALLRAELKEVQRRDENAASRRLHLRDLYTRNAEDMLAESSPEVLAAWVELLCALAEPMVGNAALARYREIDGVLDRLSTSEQDGCLYATAWMQMMHSRLHIENETNRRDLLAQATAILEPCMESANEPLRLQASKLALEQAVSAADPEVQEDAYTRALDLARPLTAVPSLAVPALGCALKALLAMQEDKERRVYANCLSVFSPEDVESLGLLAKSAYRDGKFIEACQYLELAWVKRDKPLPQDLLDMWQTAHTHWVEQGGDDDACDRNQRHLRQADNRRRR